MENIEKMSIDDKIEYWHTHETGNSLIEFLGMTEKEYFDFCLPKQAFKDDENYIVEKGGEQEEIQKHEVATNKV